MNQDMPNATRIRWDPEGESIFIYNINSEGFGRLLELAADKLETLDINESIELFLNGMLEAANGMVRKMYMGEPRDSGHGWFDEECLQTKKETRKALRVFLDSKYPIDKEKYSKSLREYKALQKRKEKEEKVKKLESLLKSLDNPREFWSEVRRHQRRPIVINGISDEQWLNHFMSILNDLDDDVDLNDIMNNVPEERTNDVTLDSVISKEEIQEAIKHLKRGKAAGPDQILNEMIKVSEPVIINFLVKLFNTVFDSGIYPQEWTKAIIVPLHKKGANDDPDNYRGISLLSSLGKVFTTVLNSRLTKWSEANDVISEAQAGFRKGRSTVDHIFTLSAMIQKQLSSKAPNNKLYAAFIDFRKAYDSINRTLLWNSVFQSGVRGKMFDLLRNMYSRVQACVRCGVGNNTEYFECLQGLKQGCVASPILFSLFINNLAKEVENGGRHGITFTPHQVELFMLLFADDLLLVSFSVIGLQNQLNILHNAALRAQLQVNLSKTKVMVFRNGGHLARAETWHYGGENLEVVNSYKYLGLIFSTKMSFNVALRDVEPRAKRGTLEICRTLRRMNCNSPGIFFKMFDAQIVPMLLYSAEVWGYQKLETIERVHTMACKRILGVSPRAPNDAVYGELGRHPLFINSAARCISYWFRLLKQPNSRYSRMAYDMLFNLNNRGRENWVTNVQKLLCCNGFGHVWMIGQVGNEKLFLKMFKARLFDCFSQEWFHHMENSSRFELYNCFKSSLEKEKYVNYIHIDNFLRTFARFRIGATEINAHRFRYSNQSDKKNCPFCPNDVEDEIHIVFHCPMYNNLRHQLIHVNRYTPYRLQLINMFVSNAKEARHRFSKFLFLSIVRRRAALVEKGD
jgi:hypothetical protein